MTVAEPAEPPPRQLLATEISILVAGAALYGAVLGSWNGPRLAAYAALKLPLLFLVTATLAAPFAALTARAFGLELGTFDSLALGLRALARTARLLASLAPIAALFTWATPPPTPEARTAHNLLYLTHTFLVALCGMSGVLELRRRLRASARSPRAAASLFVTWVALFAVVGGEVAWALRPFVGSVYEPIGWLRADALDGNVYEFIWTDIRPHLAERLFPRGLP